MSPVTEPKKIAFQLLRLDNLSFQEYLKVSYTKILFLLVTFSIKNVNFCEFLYLQVHEKTKLHKFPKKQN